MKLKCGCYNFISSLDIIFKLSKIYSDTNYILQTTEKRSLSQNKLLLKDDIFTIFTTAPAGTGSAANHRQL